jgi:hypothetical protein
VLVVDMPVALFLRGPAKLEVLALLLGAFPRTNVRFLVYGEVARSLELLLAVATSIHKVTHEQLYSAEFLDFC